MTETSTPSSSRPASTRATSRSYAYRRSWNWVFLAFIRGTLFTLLCLGPLTAGASQAPGVNPWLYALRVGIPLGFLTTFPTVSIEVWARQRRVTWLVTFLATYLAVMGGWSLGLLVGNSIHQATTQGLLAISVWLRAQFAALIVNPSLWLAILIPPLGFALTAVLRLFLPRWSYWVLTALVTLSVLGLILIQAGSGGRARPIVYLALLQFPFVALLAGIYWLSDTLLKSLFHRDVTSDETG